MTWTTREKRDPNHSGQRSANSAWKFLTDLRRVTVHGTVDHRGHPGPR